MTSDTEMDVTASRSEKMARAMKRRKRTIDDASPRPVDELLDEVASLVAEGRQVLFITGAGISVSAGIPAFRTGSGAVWEENVTKYGTRKALRKDPVDWYNAFWLPTFENQKIRTAERTPAHDALGALARLSPSVKVVTQNVDALHVGSVPDAQLIEAHGRAGLFRCAGFGDATEGRKRCPPVDATNEWYQISDLDAEDRDAIEAYGRGEGAPLSRCPRCPRCGAAVAPLSLLFDENYDSHFFFEADAWDGWLDDADAVVFAGTSFAVQVTREALRRARERRMPVYNFNVDEPPATVALANAARLRRHSALEACDVGFPKLEALVRAKLAAAGRKAPPETPLPGAPASFSTEPEEVSEDEAERPGDGDDGRVVLKAYEVPDGFASVDPPERLLGQDALTKDDLYLIICCEDGDWMLGRIAKHKPHAKRFQYDVVWADAGRVWSQGVNLEDYFDPQGDMAAPGMWRYLRKVGEQTKAPTFLRPKGRHPSVGEAPETVITPGGRGATVIERRGRGWLFVELDGHADDEGGSFERKCIRQRACDFPNKPAEPVAAKPEPEPASASSPSPEPDNMPATPPKTRQELKATKVEKTIDPSDLDPSDAPRTVITSSGRKATIVARGLRGWIKVEFDGNANHEAGAFERKSIRTTHLRSAA